jgi:hypothetical protein
MATKKKTPAKTTVKKTAAKATGKLTDAEVKAIPASISNIPVQVQKFLDQTSIPEGFVNSKLIALNDLRKRLTDFNLRPTVSVSLPVAFAAVFFTVVFAEFFSL